MMMIQMKQYLRRTRRVMASEEDERMKLVSHIVINRDPLVQAINPISDWNRSQRHAHAVRGSSSNQGLMPYFPLQPISSSALPALVGSTMSRKTDDPCSCFNRQGFIRSTFQNMPFSWGCRFGISSTDPPLICTAEERARSDRTSFSFVNLVGDG